jgi:hypothetical protein
MSDADQQKLGRLYRGLRQRALMRQDPLGTSVLESRLLPTLETVCEDLQPTDRSILPDAPPRRIAVAMALALYAHPHLVQTFAEKPTAALLFPTEVLQQALGLSPWELDDLREEVDRRAGLLLKQITLVAWLKSRYEPERLLTLLFPGLQLTNATLSFQRTHVVAFAEHRPLHRSALHLPWLTEQGFGPHTAFRGRYIDGNLRREVGRCIGLADDEVDEILESTVTLLSREGAQELISLEGWRYRGYAALTGVGGAYPKLAWLSQPADGHAARWRDWLHERRGTPTLVEPTRAFDALLHPRIHGMMEALYGDVLARRQFSHHRCPDELDVFDLSPHVAAVTAPLLAWSRARGSATEIARSLSIELDEAETLLKGVHAAWKERAAVWGQPGNAEFPHSPQAAWMRRLLRFDTALCGLSRRAPLGPDHRDLVFLFAGHFLAESPLDRGLITSTEDGGSVGLALSQWFWPTWGRILEAMDDVANTTDAEFLVPDGLF